LPQTEASDLSVKRTAGTWVVIDASSLGHGSSSSRLSAADVASGRTYSFFVDTSSSVTPSKASATAYLINERGFTPLILDDLTPVSTGYTVTARHVLLFDPRGRRKELDSGTADAIAPSSLILDTHTVLWTKNGQVQYARF
jgi:hypothetical protein